MQFRMRTNTAKTVRGSGDASSRLLAGSDIGDSMVGFNAYITTTLSSGRVIYVSQSVDMRASLAVTRFDKVCVSNLVAVKTFNELGRGYNGDHE